MAAKHEVLNTDVATVQRLTCALVLEYMLALGAEDAAEALDETWPDDVCESVGADEERVTQLLEQVQALCDRTLTHTSSAEDAPATSTILHMVNMVRQHKLRRAEPSCRRSAHGKTDAFTLSHTHATHTPATHTAVVDSQPTQQGTRQQGAVVAAADKDDETGRTLVAASSHIDAPEKVLEPVEHGSTLEVPSTADVMTDEHTNVRQPPAATPAVPDSTSLTASTETERASPGPSTIAPPPVPVAAPAVAQLQPHAATVQALPAHSIPDVVKPTSPTAAPPAEASSPAHARAAAPPVPAAVPKRLQPLLPPSLPQPAGFTANHSGLRSSPHVPSSPSRLLIANSSGSGEEPLQADSPKQDSSVSVASSPTQTKSAMEAPVPGKILPSSSASSSPLSRSDGAGLSLGEVDPTDFLPSRSDSGTMTSIQSPSGEQPPADAGHTESSVSSPMGNVPPHQVPDAGHTESSMSSPLDNVPPHQVLGPLAALSGPRTAARLDFEFGAELATKPWTKQEVAALKSAAKRFPSSMEKAARFKSIAAAVKTRSKRECLDKYKELLAEKRARRAARASGELRTETGEHNTHDEESMSDGEVSLRAEHTGSSVWTASATTVEAAAHSDLLVSDMDDVAGAHSQVNAAGGNAVDARSRSARARQMAGRGELVIDDASSEDEQSQVAGAGRSGDMHANEIGQTAWGRSSASAVAVGDRGPAASVAGRSNRAARNETVVDDESEDDIPSGKPAAAASQTSKAHRPLAAAPPLGTWDDAADGERARQASSSGAPTAATQELLEVDDIVEGVPVSSTPAASAKAAVTAAAAPSALTSETSSPLEVDAQACAAASSYLRDHRCASRSITQEEATRLRMLLFGEGRGARSSRTGRVAVRAFGDEWMQQGLYFSPTPGLRYGLVQARGGPCGALAAIQAEMIRHLFYSDVGYFDGACAADAVETEGDTWAPMEAEGCALDPSPQQQQRCLVLALSDIIWRARPDDTSAAIVAALDQTSANPGLRAVSARGAATLLRLDDVDLSVAPDGVTERLGLVACKTQAEVAAAIESNLSVVREPSASFVFDTLYAVHDPLVSVEFVQYARMDGPGVVLLVYSTMLTRGLPRIADDMDSGPAASPSLIGAHNYASQELVNLLLFGRAFSNVFDGERDMSSGADRLILHGVPSRCSVGFLTLFEHYKYVEVGQHFKTPSVPVWVVCSESHYSVIFAAPRGIAYPDAALSPAAKAAARGKSGVLPIPENARGLDVINDPKASSFDLLYFDGLARQDELIRLSVRVGSGAVRSATGTMKMGLRRGAAAADEDDSPPLERVLRTRWPDADVSWNASEPLL